MSDADIDRYDAGLLGDGGGGNVEWWHDYLRAELSRAYDFYASQMNEFFEMLEGMKTGVGTRVSDLESEITSLRTELAAMRERVEWRPIETAPMDGTRVLVKNDRGVFAASWFAEGECEDAHFDGWYIDDGKFNLRTIRGNAVTHWMPIPTDTSKETGE